MLIPNQSKTRTSHSKTFRQFPCKKDGFKYSFFCNTIVDWNKLPETIANSDSSKSFKEKLTHEVLLKTYPQLCFYLIHKQTKKLYNINCKNIETFS